MSGQRMYYEIDVMSWERTGRTVWVADRSPSPIFDWDLAIPIQVLGDRQAFRGEVFRRTHQDAGDYLPWRRASFRKRLAPPPHEEPPPGPVRVFHRQV